MLTCLSTYFNILLYLGEDMSIEYDEIGYWSEVKLEIVKKYAQAYSTILAARHRPALHHVYIDAFAGGGVHLSRTSGEFVLGSPLNALSVYPPFKEYHLIDLNPQRTRKLHDLLGDRPNVKIYTEDCNAALLEQILPSLGWSTYRRALCLLDPYGLHLDWRVLKTAGSLRTVDIFLNFPVTDMNRNVLWRQVEKASASQIARLNRFWGDESWRDVVYESKHSLFGDVLEKKSDSNEVLANAFRERLREVAGFNHVPDPMPMKNTQGAVVYYLFFASQKEVAKGIVKDIFAKYSSGGRASWLANHQ